MDESWRMRMGVPSPVTRRRASEDSTSRRSAELGRRSGLFRGSDAGNISFEDFNDVFGGPPRSVLSKKLSCDFSSYDYFYREIFRRQKDEAERSSKRGSKFPELAIPLSHRADDKAVFYDDIFKSSGNCNRDDDHVLREKKPSSSSRMWRTLSKPNWISKSKSKSKSNSSSALSYDEPIQPGIRVEDDGLNSFASKLRPLNVPCRWNSSNETGGIHNNQTSEAPFQYTYASYMIDSQYPRNEHISDDILRCSNPCFSQQFPSPEAEIPYSTTLGISVDQVENQLESPSSAKSVFCNDSEEDELSSSYVIEINSGKREISNEAADIDEAIAWAKEKFQGCGSNGEKLSLIQLENTCRFGEEKSMVPLVTEDPENDSERYPMMPLYMEEGLQSSSMQKENDCKGELLEFAELDERINSWSFGKETNIRFLLSTLQHVLWSNSGWNSIPVSNLIEHSQVKKAYQKARLCIHPDKLQQRSATTRQKYIAEKTFSILQNAWDSFISQEIFSG